MRRVTAFFLLLTLLGPGYAATEPAAPTAAADQPLPEANILRQWIAQIKASPRGPFSRIRWFCRDGSILPPEPYACRAHGGGLQHGEWTPQVKLLRQNNYLIATLLAELPADTFFQQDNWRQQLNQIVLEQYLIGIDDGWIYRQARHYRGARQVENETWYGELLLLGLIKLRQQGEIDDLYLREVVRLLPHGLRFDQLTKMRQLALEIEASDPAFATFRNKLHTNPEVVDAAQVRAYGNKRRAEEQDKYLQLANLIEQTTRADEQPLELARELLPGPLRQRSVTEIFAQPPDRPLSETGARFKELSELLLMSRHALPQPRPRHQTLQLLDNNLALEQEFYRTANRLLPELPGSSRWQRLSWLEQGVNALYGIGFLSERQWRSQRAALTELRRQPLPPEVYHRELRQLQRLSRWIENNLRYQFEAEVDHLAPLEPKVASFFQERLRGSPVLPLSLIIDGLLRDSQQLRGVQQQLFGRPTSGLEPLNPGLAFGRLELVDDPQHHSFAKDRIYLLPETIAELPPVAGILTRGAGNSLSHMQLLARNLGIPNLAVDEALLPQLARHADERILLAVSPGGVVKLENAPESAPQEIAPLASREEILIEPDLAKLDLSQRTILSLAELRATDSGRIAGPKAANLGELKHRYRELVPDALVIPFGRFYQLLQTTRTAAGQSLFGWMQDNYRRLAALAEPAERLRQTELFLGELRQQIASAPLPAEFLTELREKLQAHFGPDGSFGVFVRSDTNVEDLPNFTGAGLNKTVPNVVGFAAIISAVRSVWASPFSLRAYQWRQAHMAAPEQVYASVLLMQSVPAEKSGVLVTTDLNDSDPEQLHVATNEGVGGAVSGQRAEELLINKQSGAIRLLAQASASQKRVLLPAGGVRRVRATAPDYLLNEQEIEQLRRMAELLPARSPELQDVAGRSRPADIEFGFVGGRFILFQIRPLLQSKRVQNDLLLAALDARIRPSAASVDLSAPAAEPEP